MTKITFLGAARTVTGSKYLVEHAGTKLLIDCGVFQGSRQLRELNWQDPDLDLKNIAAVLLTHAHIDHTGNLPRYHKLGMRKCPIYCTSATADLVKILLPDMGRLQEQEATYRIRKGRSRHPTPEPYFTEQEARTTLKQLSPVSFHKRVKIAPQIYATWYHAGHILGAGIIQLELGSQKITFSGDLGRYDVPILLDPEFVDFGNLLLVESTYGNRQHSDVPAKEMLAKIVNDTFARQGTVMIPSFAVGRAQLLLYYLRELKLEQRIPNLPVIVDSPMATDATVVYKQHPDCYDEEALGIVSRGNRPFAFDKLAFVTETEASIQLNKITEPMIIISPSGMLTGGRILHHLKHRIGKEEHTVLFVGHQPAGGRGAWIQGGAETLKLFGTEYKIRAHVETIPGFSAHAGKAELLKWCGGSQTQPDQVAVVHGEEESCQSFAKTLQTTFDWQCSAPILNSVIKI